MKLDALKELLEAGAVIGVAVVVAKVVGALLGLTL